MHYCNTFVLGAILSLLWLSGHGFSPLSTTVRKLHLKSVSMFKLSKLSLATRKRSSGTHLRMGLLDSFKKVVGSSDPTEALQQENDNLLKRYMQTVEKINALEATYEVLSDEELNGKTEEFKSRLQKGESLDSLLVDAFAVVREASWRVLKLRHFDVQVREKLYKAWLLLNLLKYTAFDT